MKLCRLGYHVVFFQCTLAVYLSDLVNKPLNRLATYYKQDVEQRHNNWIFNPRVARNVILLLVEGLDSHTMSVARQVLETQTSTVNNYITAVDFFLSGQLKPASRDFIVADPAAAVSAIFNGLPEYNGQMGWVEQGEASCLTFDRSKKLLKNLFKVMSEAGKMTGLVTTTRLTSPGVAGAFAATPDMQMESDIHLAEAGCNDGKFKDIAAQLIKDYKDLNIIIGQGREYFMKPSNRSSNSSVYPWRRDLDLKTYWAMEKLLRKKTYREAVGTKAVKDALRGQDNLQYFLGFLDEVQSSPASDDLQDLVSLVVNVLNGKPNNNGYFLTIYDDQLARDHENDAYNVGTDLNNILKAVNYLDTILTRADDTLIVLASVQGSTLTLSSGRLHEESIVGSSFTDTCDLELSKIRYPEGSRSRDNGTGRTNSQDPTGGPDLPVFSRGPGAQAFTGVNDLAYLYHAILYATCLGTEASTIWDHCQSAPTARPPTASPAPDTNTTRGPFSPGPTSRRPTFPPPIWPWVPQPLPHQSGNPYGTLGLPYYFNNAVSNPKPLPNQPVPIRSPNTNSNANQIPTRSPTSRPDPIPTPSPNVNTNVGPNRLPAPLPNPNPAPLPNPNPAPIQNPNPAPPQNPFNWASLFPFFF
ncbi:hypothetical protein BsWGS_26778 [Bradybaena similaris]